MRFSASLLRSAFVLLAGLVLNACLPAVRGQLDEEREPHFLAGKARVSSLDYKGAIESFEKALEVNPQSGAAHFELACLFEDKEVDPAAAIYHYEHYLKLRPNADNGDVVKQRIFTCKQELARTVSLGPVTEKVQKELDQLAQENKRLTDENKRLHDDLDKWTAYASQLQQLTNRGATSSRVAAQTAAPGTPTTSTIPSASSGTDRRPAPTAGASARTHTIKPGETPSTIAKKYGIKLEALMTANPRVDARRLQIGQNLLIPAS
jgi:LysM repeat protein